MTSKGMRNGILGILFILMIMISSSIAEAKDFTIKDVPKTDEAYDRIQWVLNQEYMNLATGKFLPNSSVKRGEFAAILTKVDGEASTLSRTQTSSFIDVQPKDPFFKYIETEKSNMTFFKNTKGKLFKPNSYITREEACLSIVKIMGYDKADASQVDTEVSLDEMIKDAGKVSPAVEKYVTLAVQNDLMELREAEDGSYLDPKSNITRKQLALFLYNAYQNKDFSVEDEVSYEDTVNDSGKENATSVKKDPVVLDSSGSKKPEGSGTSESPGKTSSDTPEGGSKASIYDNSEKAVANAERCSDGKKVDLLTSDTNDRKAHIAVMKAIEAVDKLDKSSSMYAAYMERLRGVNNVILNATYDRLMRGYGVKLDDVAENLTIAAVKLNDNVQSTTAEDLLYSLYLNEITMLSATMVIDHLNSTVSFLDSVQQKSEEITALKMKLGDKAQIATEDLQTKRYSNREVYVGELQNGEPNGYGVYTYENGDQYTGFWKNGQKDGPGTLCYASGAVYIGQWVNDKMQGMGYDSSPGQVFFGEWADGLREGQGSAYAEDGTVIYVGLWKKDRPE